MRQRQDLSEQRRILLRRRSDLRRIRTGGSRRRSIQPPSPGTSLALNLGSSKLPLAKRAMRRALYGVLPSARRPRGGPRHGPWCAHDRCWRIQSLGYGRDGVGSWDRYPVQNTHSPFAPYSSASAELRSIV